MTFTEVCQLLEAATTYEDVFGTSNGAKPTDKWLKERYQRLARQVHPDMRPEPERREASHAFAHLQQFMDTAQAAILKGAYGQPQLRLTTANGTHLVGRRLFRGDVCDLYEATTTATAGSTPTLLKVARAQRDNDLLVAERTALRRLATDSTFAMFYPHLVDHLLYADGRGRRQANVLERLDGWYSLADIRRAYPRGIPAIHMAWIWRRLLWLLGHAHQCGMVHGAVLPDHLVILPPQHGVMLIDWCYSATSDDGAFVPIKAIVPAYQAWYPDEVIQKKAPSPATDIAMAAGCMQWLLGGELATGEVPGACPPPLWAFLCGCRQTAQSRRPQDAWQLLGEFDALLGRMGSPYYPRKFQVFTMPGR